jgi:hypothetical protein
MIARCRMEGCLSTYVDGEDESVRYLCSHHTDEELRAAGILTTERTDKDAHFQDQQFDKQIKRPLNRKYWVNIPDSPEFPRSTLDPTKGDQNAESV